MIEEAGLVELRAGDSILARSPEDEDHQFGSPFHPGWIVGPGAEFDTWKVTFATREDKRGESWVVDFGTIHQRKIQTLGRERITFVMRNYFYPKGSEVYHRKSGRGRVLHVSESRFMMCDVYTVECGGERICAYAGELQSQAPAGYLPLFGVGSVEETERKIPILIQCSNEEIFV
jgi:hypothetical protein